MTVDLDAAEGVDVVTAWLEATVGVRVDGHQAARLHGRVHDRMRAEGCPDGHAYLALLRRDGDAVAALLDAVAVGETYFLRDDRQMRLLVDHVLPTLRRAAAGRFVDAWSAGCATGEEAYTLAALAAESAVPVRVLGTDVSPAMIEHAATARYGGRSLRVLDDQRRRAWLVPEGDGLVVRPTVRQRVRFRAANLLDPVGERFDLVVCRNVLIYLSPAAVRRVTTNLVDALRPGGFLLTGASDPPVEHPHLEVVRTAHGLVHRRPDRTPAPGPPPARPPAPPRAPLPPPVVSAPPLPATSPPTSPRPEAAPAADRIRHLADDGRHDEALAELQRAVALAPVDAELHYLGALLHLAAGQPAAAVAAARSALYLAPDLAVAHLVLGRAELARGNRAAASRSFETAARELAARPPDDPVPMGDGQPAGHLAAVAAQLAQTEGDGDDR